MKKMKLPRNCRPCFSIAELIDSKFLQTETYIDDQCKGSYKKTKTKAITRVKIGKNQKL